jgi:CHAT domain-containing protein
MDKEVTKSKVIHISCHGHDTETGTYLELENQEFVGSLQKLTKNVIEKKNFKENQDEIRLIVLSACSA